jgi:ABC-type glycerol-3-phosphate transport system substrate-binding protein
MLKRRAALRLAWPLLLVVAVACSATGGTPSAQTTSSGPVTLKIEDYSVEQIDFHKQVAAAYHRVAPNVTIEWQSIQQAQYKQTLPLAFQSKQAPDVFYWTEQGSNTMNQLLGNGWIRPLTADGKVPDDWLKRWPSGSFLNGINQKDGKVYGFQWQDTRYWGPGYMYLNKAVLQAAGLDPSKPPTTWSQLGEACGQIKARTKAYCLAVPMKDVDLQRLWFALAAGRMNDRFFDLKTGHFDLNDPRLMDVFNYVQGLYRAGYMAPGVNSKDFSRQQLAAGQAAIYMDGPWMVSVWDQLGFHSDSYSVAPYPRPDSGPRGALSQAYGQNAYWMSSQTQHQAEAWKFIQWMTDPTGFFVQNFLKNSFATLAFADNKKYLTDPAWKQVFKIGDASGWRVLNPEPLLKCPALAGSTAFATAQSTHPNWEYEVMVDALVNNKDLAPAAKQVADGRQQLLEQGLAKDQGQGMKVSLDCFTFPSWNYDQSFDARAYPKS